MAILDLLSHLGQLDLSPEFDQTTKYLSGFPLLCLISIVLFVILIDANALVILNVN